jgi:hypothetical protein
LGAQPLWREFRLDQPLAVTVQEISAASQDLLLVSLRVDLDVNKAFDAGPVEQRR